MKAAQQAEASFAAERKRVENLTKNLQKLQDDMEVALQNERQTVSLLVTEKAHLTAELQKRADFESSRYPNFFLSHTFPDVTAPEAQDLEDELEAERVKSDNLTSEVQGLQEVVSKVVSRAELSEAKEKEIAEQYREQARLPLFCSLSHFINPSAGTAIANLLCFVFRASQGSRRVSTQTA